MKPTKVTMSAFGPYKEEVVIDFTQIGEKGIFLITGDTGAGKTTIFDAISYALYGEASGSNRTVKSVRSDFADIDTPTFVKLEFSHKGKNYIVTRNPEYERPKKKTEGTTVTSADASMECDGEVIANNIKKVNEKSEEILGINAKQFKQIVMLAQGEFLNILFAGSDNRTEIFRKIFDTTIYKKIQDKIAMKFKNSKDELELSQKEFTTNASNIRWKNEENEYDVSSIKKLTLADTKEVLKRLEREVEENKQQFKESDKLLKNIEKDITTKDKELTELENKNKQIDLYQALLKERENLDKEEKEIKELKSNIDKCQKILAKVAPKEEKVKSTDTEINKLKQEISYINGILTLNRNSEIEVDKKVKKLADLKKSIDVFEKEKTNNEELEKVISKITNITNISAIKEKSDKKYLENERKFKEINEEYIEKSDERKREMAGILAENLKENEACPVCGSKTHPCIAHKSKSVLTEEELEALKNSVEKVRKQKEESFNETVELKSRIDTLISELGIKAEELESYQEKVNKEYKEKQEKNIENINKISEIYKQITSKRFVLETFDYEKVEAEVKEEEKAIKDKILKNKTQAEEKDKLLKTKEQDLEVLVKDYENAFKTLGFESEEAYKKSIYSEKEIEEYQDKIDKFNNKNQENKTRIKDLEETVKGLEKVDVTEKVQELTKLRTEQIDKKSEQMEINSVMQNNQSIFDKLNSNNKELEKILSEYLVLEELDDTANGKLTGKRRIKFEQYVQATYFDMVIAEANKRLSVMTENRFYLVRREESQNISDKVALELDVMDNYNSKKRDVKSLSGGESFKASLSLALGLSDVIQSYSGGVVVDTLFIDEGFGSLDTDSREQAIATLMQLSDNDKLIGIISHVSELKDAIDKKIIIEKSIDGSKIKMEV